MDEYRNLTYRQRWGLLAAVQTAILNRLHDWFGLHIFGLYSRQLNIWEMPKAGVPGFSFRLFVQGEDEALIAHVKRPELGLSPQFIRLALEKGDVCNAILHDGMVVAYSWSAFTPTHVADGVYADFGKKCRYGYKFFTLPEYRGQHLPREFKSCRDQYCLNVRGCTHSIALVAFDNRSSIHAFQALGNCRVGFAGYLKRGRKFWSFITPGARKLGFDLFLPAPGRR